MVGWWYVARDPPYRSTSEGEMPAYGSFSFLDGSQEPASTKLWFADGTTYTQGNAVRTAMEAVSSMQLMRWQFGVEYPIYSGLGAGSRETKILVRCHDSSNGKPYSFSIPGFTTGIDLITGTDFLDLDDTEAAALLAAIEACVVTPWYQNLVVVDSMERTRGYK